MRRLSSIILSVGMILSLNVNISALDGENLDKSEKEESVLEYLDQNIKVDDFLNNEKLDSIEVKPNTIKFEENKNDNDSDGTQKKIDVKTEENQKIKNINVRRIYGRNRYLTSVEISKMYFSHSEIVVVASGEGYIDALVGGSLVSQLKVPLLLVKNKKIHSYVKDEIKRLNAKKVILIGGEKTISPKVAKEIASLGPKIDRISGANRYRTAEKIAFSRYHYHTELNNINLPIGENYVGIDSKNYPDALIAASIVGQISGNYLSYMIPNAKNNSLSRDYWIVFGGEQSIPRGKYEKYRIKGVNRYETSVDGARKFELLTGKKLKTVILTDGRKYPDALAASTVAGKEGATVLLTRNDRLHRSVIEFLKEGNIENVIIVGGYDSVGLKIQNEITGLKF